MTAGCIPFPIPSSGNLYKNEQEIVALANASSTRKEVIARLGKPAREYRDDISYLGCYKPGGYGYLIIVGYPVGGGGDVTRGAEKCYEFVLHFNELDQLDSFEKLPFDGYLTVPASTLQMYFDDPSHEDAKTWLCMSADEGDVQAQYRLALLYENGSEGLPKDYLMAYVWYRLAKSNGNYMRSGEQAARIIDYLNSEQSMRAEKLIREWKPGMCEKSVIYTLESAVE